MTSGFQQEAKNRNMKKEYNRPMYTFMKDKNDGSWEVYKDQGDLSEVEYQVSALGQCTCKGYKYNNSCKHSDIVTQNKIWEEGVDQDFANMIKEKANLVYDFDSLELESEEKNDNGEICKMVFKAESNKYDQYEKLIAKSEKVPLLIVIDLI